MRKLIGFIDDACGIPEVENDLHFCTPVYQDSDSGQLEFHRLDEANKIILSFDKVGKKSSAVIDLPPLFRRDIEIGDPTLCILVNKNLFFVGNDDDFEPYSKSFEEFWRNEHRR